VKLILLVEDDPGPRTHEFLMKPMGPPEWVTAVKRGYRDRPSAARVCGSFI
jgi:hypothetical protein